LKEDKDNKVGYKFDCRAPEGGSNRDVFSLTPDANETITKSTAPTKEKTAETRKHTQLSVAHTSFKEVYVYTA
jgi:hypothetical protein